MLFISLFLHNINWYNIEWYENNKSDGSNYSRGVYFYRIVIQSDKLAARQAGSSISQKDGGSSTGDYTETKKLVLIKRRSHPERSDPRFYESGFERRLINISH